MARKRDTAEPIIGTRREAAVARGRREDGGLRVDQAQRRTERERENGRWKTRVADQALDNAIRTAVASGNCCARRAGARRSRPRGPRWSSRRVGPVGSSPRRAARSGTPPGWRRTPPP